MKNLLLIILMIIISSCDPKVSWNNIQFNDNTKNTKLRLLYKAPYCTDSLLPISNPFVNGIGLSPYEMGLPLPILNTMGCKDLSSCINDFPQKAFSCFLFDMDTLLNVPWDSIRLHNNYIKKFIIKSSDVTDKNEYIVNYP